MTFANSLNQLAQVRFLEKKVVLPEGILDNPRKFRAWVPNLDEDTVRSLRELGVFTVAGGISAATGAYLGGGAEAIVPGAVFGTVAGGSYNFSRQFYQSISRMRKAFRDSLSCERRERLGYFSPEDN